MEGKLYDRITNEPIIYGTIGISNTSIGTVSNLNSEFQLNVPDSLYENQIKFSHIGYQSEQISASLLMDQHISISLNPKVIPLQEIVVRAVNPQEVLRNMIEKRKDNYSSKPAYLTSFYREGSDYKKKNIDLTEAILKVYKNGYNHDAFSDQTKLIKMRRIMNKQETDTLLTKMKSGIYSCLLLDVIKELPDFLTLSDTSPYIYIYTDISIIDDRRVNVLSFEQRKEIKEPLYKGELFIDSENFALVELRFEINPDYIEKATKWFIEKKSPDITLKLQHAKYKISYKLSDNDTYYINHVRGDLEFKVRKKSHWFSSTLDLWFEMVTCKIETENVKGFSRKDRLSPHKIFSETRFHYDKRFWGDFNVILPEEKLKETILNNLSEITETIAE